jgi:hypothetical protein
VFELVLLPRDECVHFIFADEMVDKRQALEGSDERQNVVAFTADVVAFAIEKSNLQNALVERSTGTCPEPSGTLLRNRKSEFA